jgi:hypothetical protein
MRPGTTQFNAAYDYFGNGEFGFVGQGGIGSGNDFADFLFGLPQYFQQGPDARTNARSKLFSGFAQDEWRVNKKLTLTLGVRYEYSTPKLDTHGSALDREQPIFQSRCVYHGASWKWIKWLCHAFSDVLSLDCPGDCQSIAFDLWDIASQLFPRAGTNQPGLDAFQGYGVERATKLEIRVDVFNVFNHAEFADPITNITSPEFGDIINTGSNVAGSSAQQRILQLAARFSF